MGGVHIDSAPLVHHNKQTRLIGISLFLRLCDVVGTPPPSPIKCLGCEATLQSVTSVSYVSGTNSLTAAAATAAGALAVPTSCHGSHVGEFL